MAKRGVLIYFACLPSGMQSAEADSWLDRNRVPWFLGHFVSQVVLDGQLENDWAVISKHKEMLF